eukprot:scaffold3440_cov316-Prasinococcus_capsulatus_cf.AAC.1
MSSTHCPCIAPPARARVGWPGRRARAAAAASHLVLVAVGQGEHAPAPAMVVAPLACERAAVVLNLTARCRGGRA